jgi:UDP-glucose 4-epimerase
MTRILVTGGAGFIGSHIVENFQGKAEVRVLDNLRSGFKRNLDKLDVEFIEGSVTDRQIVRKAVQGVDYVFHLAAMVSVPESMDKPAECIEINTNGTLIVLQEAAEASVRKFIHSSSSAIYGDNPVLPKIETMLPEPKSPYAVTKLDGEYYCRMFADEGWLKTASLRYFNVFGPRQDPKSQYAAAIPIFIHKALRDEDIIIFGDGEQTRDFIFVKDVVAANIFMATQPEATRVYNVARSQSQTVTDLAERIIELTGSDSKIVYAPERAGDIKHSYAAVDSIKSAGFIPEYGFDEGLKQTIDFFRDFV